MAVTKDFGRLFFHIAPLPRQARLLGISPTQEIDPPFRRSDSLVVRIFPLNIGLVIGLWQDTEMDEEEALLTAIEGTKISLVEEDGEGEEDMAINREDRQAVLKRISSLSTTLDDEWEVINMMGLQELLDVDVEDAVERVRVAHAETKP